MQENLIPPELTRPQINAVYASEADVLNMELFGMSAKECRENNPDGKGNIRDYADISQLVCLSNLENLNAHFISDGLLQPERLAKLNAIAIHQMTLLTSDATARLIRGETGDGRDINCREGASYGGCTHPGSFLPPFTKSGTLFRSHSPKNRSHVFRGAQNNLRLAGTERSACQKSAGIDRLRVEKPGWDVELVAI